MTLKQTRTRLGQVFPSPRENETMFETPPTFVFLREEGEQDYTVVVRRPEGEAVWTGRTGRNFVTPEIILEPGEYEWNLYRGEDERGWVRFSVAENAVRFLRPDAKAIFDAVPDIRPRELFYKADAAEIVRTHENAVETLRRNVAQAYADGLPVPPRYHKDPDALPYREYFGRHRDFCDRDLVACCEAYVLLGDEKAGAHAKTLFLTLCDWNSEGPCSLEGIWGDEVGLSHARCFPAVYDMLYELLDEKQRIFCARVVSLYAFQCERLLNRIDFCQNPGNSHAGRLPAYLGEAAMVLKGTGVVPEETLVRWLSFAVDIYGGIFPYFGGPDGGWAEGMFYSSSYTKWFLPFFSAVERFSGVSFLKRPFYQRLIDYFQHFCPPDWEIHPFGDGYWCKSDDPEWPGFFSQNPYHIYAERFGAPMMREWSKRAQKQELFKLHLLDVFLPEGKPEPDSLSTGVQRARLFPDAGFVSLHTDPEHPESELALLSRSSRYGSFSHEHADHGSFALMAGGTALISPSGYFGRNYGTKHHFEWTNQTVAHNAILIDGEGQKARTFGPCGRVLYAKDENGVLTGAVDATDAYERAVKWERSFELTGNELVVRDHIELDEPGEITYLLHSLSKPYMREDDREDVFFWNTIGEQREPILTIDRNGWRLSVEPMEGELTDLEISDKFGVDLNEGVPEKYQVTMPPQYHMRWTTKEKKKVHDICVTFTVTRQD